MTRTIIIFIFSAMFITGFSQARNDSDGLYYDLKGKIFTGTVYEYYPDSVIHASIEVKEGKVDGQTRVYFENCQLEEIRSFSMGQMHGKWEKWNRQNVKIAEASYTNNRKDGKWYVWDDNGTLRYDMTYRNGEKAGTWLMYDDKGSLSDQKHY